MNEKEQEQAEIGNPEPIIEENVEILPEPRFPEEQPSDPKGLGVLTAILAELVPLNGERAAVFEYNAKRHLAKAYKAGQESERRLAPPPAQDVKAMEWLTERAEEGLGAMELCTTSEGDIGLFRNDSDVAWGRDDTAAGAIEDAAKKFPTGKPLAPIDHVVKVLKDSDIIKLCHHLGLHTWNGGDEDGYGGEYEVDPRTVKKIRTWFDAHMIQRCGLQDILFAAYKFDDKPHQLFSAIRNAAKGHKDEAEIIRLMDRAYATQRSGDGPRPKGELSCGCTVGECICDFEKN